MCQTLSDAFPTSRKRVMRIFWLNLKCYLSSPKSHYLEIASASDFKDRPLPPRDLVILMQFLIDDL